ncbi:MAG TPA: VOC family protein [Opitutaceae bacterium]|nr:VOC family protein [Opitutaceae bacterium]
MTPTPTAPPARLTASAPVLLVRDVVKSANHYRDALGFSYDRFWGEPPSFVILRRDEIFLMLNQAPLDHGLVPHWKVSPNMWNVYFWVTDADGLLAEFRRRGATIDYDAHDKPYGIREFGVQDIDGYDIGFGQPIPLNA